MNINQGVFNLEVYSEFVFDLDKDIQIVYQSLLPELEGSHHRTCSELIKNGNSLIFKVQSDDLVSMRASLNGWLRLIKIAVEMAGAIEN